MSMSTVLRAVKIGCLALLLEGCTSTNRQGGVYADYCVIDLSIKVGGTYAVSYINKIPRDANWNDYKTTKILLRRIDAGRFLFQKNKTEEIPRMLYMGVFEVTQRQWELVSGLANGYFTDDTQKRRPADCIDWRDCHEFCSRLVLPDGMEARLPTEREWEYACLAGNIDEDSCKTGKKQDRLEDMGWYAENSGERTHPVGEKLPNAWGMYDMLGNVAEWCQDAGDVKAGLYEHIVRGGSWCSSAADCASWSRRSKFSGSRSIDQGFRIVCTVFPLGK